MSTSQGKNVTIEATYMGMPVQLNDHEVENQAYFSYCASHRFRLQQCIDCQLLRYPPTTACPFCASASAQWVPVEGRGEIHSYTEVHHAIQPAFKAHVPYCVLLVDLDVQRGIPEPGTALRVVGNFCGPDGTLAPADRIDSIGIGTRVRMVFSDLAPGLSLPQWTIDEAAKQPGPPWRPPA